MDASDGAAAVQISTETPKASFPEAARAPNAVEVTKCEEKVDDLSLPVSKKVMEGESYGSKSLFAGEELMGSTRNNRAMEESYGSSRLLAEDAHTVGVAEESYESRRLLLSCSMASARVKKKRRSRASSKAPIKVFSTDTSNFMAMVHKLTGIPSNVSPFHSNLPSPWAPKILPFNQGLPTLDTSTLLLPSLSGNRVLSGSGYSGMQVLPPQQQQQQQQVMNTASQAGLPLAANMECISSSYSDLMRSMCSSVNTSSLPRLWEASSYTSSKSGAHQVQQNSFNEKGGILRQEEPSHQDAAMERNRPTFNTLSRLEMLLAGHDKLSSTSSTALTSCIAKEERL